MRKERVITIKVINVKNISNRKMAEFFARKYMEKKDGLLKEKS